MYLFKLIWHKLMGKNMKKIIIKRLTFYIGRFVWAINC